MAVLAVPRPLLLGGHLYRSAQSQLAITTRHHMPELQKHSWTGASPLFLSLRAVKDSHTTIGDDAELRVSGTYKPASVFAHQEGQCTVTWLASCVVLPHFGCHTS